MNVNYFNQDPNFPPILRQTFGKQGKFGDLQFSTNDLNAEWQLVGSHTKSIEGIKDKKIIYLAQEPPEYIKPNKEILEKCLASISCKNIEGIKTFILPPVLQWTYGQSITLLEGKGHQFDHSNYLTLEDLITMYPPKKEKLCSMILSNKDFLPGHKKRIQFAGKVQEHFQDKVDVFGFGHNPILDKRDAIDPYVFSIAIENCFLDNYFSEKLTDVFIGNTMPIYHGCPNITEYFDEESFIRLDIDNIDKSISIIENAFNNLEIVNVRKIFDSRLRVLIEYNMFKFLHDVIKDLS